MGPRLRSSCPRTPWSWKQPPLPLRLVPTGPVLRPVGVHRLLSKGGPRGVTGPPTAGREMCPERPSLSFIARLSGRKAQSGQCVQELASVRGFSFLQIPSGAPTLPQAEPMVSRGVTASEIPTQPGSPPLSVPMTPSGSLACSVFQVKPEAKLPPLLNCAVPASLSEQPQQLQKPQGPNRTTRALLAASPRLRVRPPAFSPCSSAAG